MPNSMYIIQSSPHFKDRDSVPKIMYTVVIALLPAMLASLYFFRFRAVGLYVSCLVACLATEALFLWIRKKPIQSLGDGSAVITALLLAMILPPALSLELAVIGSVVAVAIGKQVFGGLGHNIFNPALVGRAFLQTAFPVAMTTWLPPATLSVDTATFATPLGNLKFQEAVAQGVLTPLKDLFWGNIGGCLGETSAIALLLGALLLLYKKTIDWRIPVGIILVLSAFTGAFWLANPDKYASPVFHVLAGGLLIGAFYMATDMVTSPITPKGTWIYALGIGLIVGLVRLFGGFPEGVMYSILFMNTFVPLLNRFFRPRILGERRAVS
ncbi:MAG: RnfABCDGE type electron transport complex subunit D [Candidatus Aminicenantes bacterium]|nr:RnfABCDGE type electron transport complex subunit D [Candidatus Aminicenantes bacterium]MDH5383219.1 RnfABCDGE type electron transport complex subunit D [Candidatus Aminicenantes bacterium]MDH5741991.1 RnfABCDGE type electron transport complex subunit D [Candidatus Aminicenantes bacterium]